MLLTMQCWLLFLIPSFYCGLCQKCWVTFGGPGSRWGQRCWWAWQPRQWSKAIFGNRQLQQIEWRSAIDAKSSPFPPPRPFPPTATHKLPSTLLSTVLSIPHVTVFISLRTELSFKSLAICRFHQFSVSLDGANGLIQFPHLSTLAHPHISSLPNTTISYFSTGRCSRGRCSAYLAKILACFAIPMYGFAIPMYGARRQPSTQQHLHL